MQRLMTIGVYTTICIVAVGIGLFVASFFASNSSLPGGVATPGVTEVGQAATPAAPSTVAPTAAPEPSSAPSSTTATAAPTATAPATAAPTATAAPATAAPTSAPATAAPTTAPTTAPATPDYIEYTIQPGDILYRIAVEYDVTIEEILAINEIPNPASLIVGDVIRIPRK